MELACLFLYNVGKHPLVINRVIVCDDIVGKDMG